VQSFRQITTSHYFFTARMPFLSPNQHCQSTEGIEKFECVNEVHEMCSSERVTREQHTCYYSRLLYATSKNDVYFILA